MLLKISFEAGESIRAHGAAGYPYEICGALLGHDAGEDREVVTVFPLENQRHDSPQNRFVITPADVMRADAVARQQRLEVVGWYHSHPDHAARPSQFDRENAWPWYSYVILRVADRRAQEMTSWRLRNDRSGFDEETIENIARATV